MTATVPTHFLELVGALTSWLADRPIVPALAADLTAAFPPDGPFFTELTAACRAGLDAGWLGNRGAMPLRYGRVVKPSPHSHGFSIDVVAMADVVGPHHVHPNGEIDMVMPFDAAARFDGHPAGWVVYPPQSAHAPTVTGGTAAILYVLPDGAITF
jgi:hypothetical protein